MSGYSNDYSSSSSDLLFSVSDKTSDESDTTTRSSCMASIIDYIFMHVCGSIIQHALPGVMRSGKAFSLLS